MSVRQRAPRAAPPPLADGTDVAPGFRLLGHLGRGNALDVHDAWSDEHGARCIVKLARPDRVDDGPTARRLRAEGRLLRRLCHPHIVRGYSVLADPRPIVVMETLTGETLAHLIERSDPRMPAREIAHLALHLGSALAYLHGQGILHLDLKPSNVIAEVPRAKVIDLSLARPPGRARGGAGTWCYMAPEQVHGGVLTAAADVWGLGATLFEAAAGTPPFEASGEDSDPDGSTASGPDPEDRVPAPALRTLRRLPAPLHDLIEACLATRPEDRPALRDVLSALESVAGLVPADRRWGAAR